MLQAWTLFNCPLWILLYYYYIHNIFVVCYPAFLCSRTDSWKCITYGSSVRIPSCCYADDSSCFPPWIFLFQLAYSWIFVLQVVSSLNIATIAALAPSWIFFVSLVPFVGGFPSIPSTASFLTGYSFSRWLSLCIFCLRMVFSTPTLVDDFLSKHSLYR